LQKNKAPLGISIAALGIIAGTAVSAGIGSAAPQIAVTGPEVVITGADFHTASGIARPFAGALAANRLADSSAWTHAQNIAAGRTYGSAQLPSGVTARAVLQSLVAQHNDAVAGLPNAWQ